jgi:hypothetical protein
MPRGKTPPVAQLPQIRVDDRVIIVSEGPRKGQDGTVAEVNAKKKQVRLTEWGWIAMSDIELLDEAGRAAADAVDGQDANVVLDGTSGGPKDEAMIKPPLDDLVHSLARAKAVLERATAAKQRANEEFKDAQGQYNAVGDEIVLHYGEVEQLGLNLQGSGKNGQPAAGVDPDEDDEEEEDTVRAGSVRSYRGREGPE